MICPTCKRAFLAPKPTAAGRPPGTTATTATTLKAAPPLPFCSERCRAADLGNWLDGNYRITTPASEEELDRGPDIDPEN